ncbi:hypothetical protein Bcep18194_C6579 [Burkholderia lata]|uniref:DUF2878 domain-containing protein n=2 Tax=Burkholderia lata (strain ATCC 17760 / DSM 23089 / LMG 22485 / NCIMB 9086 / R18194 / 383) TaxID=482957 RepID=Q39PI7_BURL3|nr:hypothetical protein Bcep18194_C6579 [Burkholderia lata]
MREPAKTTAVMSGACRPMIRSAAAETAAYLALSQAGWFVCVLSAAHGRGWIGTLCAGLLAGAHLLRARAHAREAALMAIVTALGWSWDAVPVATGWLRYPNGVLLEGAAPYWIAGLWVLFSTQLNVSLRWLRERWLTAALLGAVAGPLSFRAGATLGAVQIASPAAWVLLGCGWGILLPSAVWLARRLDGTRHEP